MRKNILLLVIVALFAVSVCTAAFAAKPVPQQANYQSQPVVLPVTEKDVKAIKSSLYRISGKKGRLVKIEEALKDGGTLDKSLEKKFASVYGELDKVEDVQSQQGVTLTGIKDTQLQQNTRFDFLEKSIGTTWAIVILGMITLAVLMAGFFIILRSGIGGVRRKIDEAVVTIVRDVPAAVKALESIVVDIADVAGFHVIYVPPIVDNMYLKVHVPSTVTTPVDDPTKITRSRTTDIGDLRRSLRKSVADYITNNAPGAPAPATEQARQKLALMKHLLNTGEIIIRL